jgi:peptide chain release factor subunit 1
MITPSDLERLVHHPADGAVVSLYLNVTPPRNYLSELNSLIHARREDLARIDSMPRQEARAVADLLDRLAQHVRGLGGVPPHTRLLVVVASTTGLWMESRLPVGLPSRLVIAPTPYVRPLAALFDDFPRYGVLVVDGRRARFFVLAFGEVEGADEWIEDDVPSRARGAGSAVPVAPGVWGGVGAARIERHIQDHLQRHLKRAADHARAALAARRFQRLIIGGPDNKSIPSLTAHLHGSLRQVLIGTIQGRPDDPLSALAASALAVGQAWERERDARRVGDLLDASNAGGLAVVGLEPTLEALMLGQVHTLVVHAAYRVAGGICRQDHYLSSYVKTCPICGSPMTPTDDLVEEMVEEALLQDAELAHVAAAPAPFTRLGVGAVLRFRLG